MIGCEDIGKSREREWASHMALVVKNPPANEGDVKDTSSTSGLGRSGGGHGNSLQYSCQENPMDFLAGRIPWTEEPGGLRSVHQVAKSRTQLK